MFVIGSRLAVAYDRSLLELAMLVGAHGCAWISLLLALV